jgi:hypothetical protein
MQTHIRKVIGVSFAAAAAAPVIFGPNAASMRSATARGVAAASRPSRYAAIVSTGWV